MNRTFDTPADAAFDAREATPAVAELDTRTGRVTARKHVHYDNARDAVNAVDAMALCMAQSAFGG